MIPALLRQRQPRVELPQWLQAARGEFCTVLHPEHCVGGTETTVAAHSNWSKGVGAKTDDFAIAFACAGCHDWLDQTRDPDRMRLFFHGHMRTLRRLYELGIL